jgi:hypothetical protein|tara:strand:+ start:270 stop:512 length:243 start_codon:yes stop_codon:yes gene_type:complete
MKKYKIRLTGMGIEATGIIPFEKEPTIKEVEDMTAAYLDEKLMKVEHDTNFYTDDRYNLTYEELPEKKEKEKQLVLGEWV